jgi:hypothetical protein
MSRNTVNLPWPINQVGPTGLVRVPQLPQDVGAVQIARLLFARVGLDAAHIVRRARAGWGGADGAPGQMKEKGCEILDVLRRNMNPHLLMTLGQDIGRY